MTKNRSLGVVLIIIGVSVNNYAYMTDIVGNTHEGLVYMGWRGMVAAAGGLFLVMLGVFALLRASSDQQGHQQQGYDNRIQPQHRPGALTEN